MVTTPWTAEVSREFKATPERVYRAWTVPEEYSEWWGALSPDFKPEVTMDVRVGGRFRVKMVTPRGPTVALGEYVEIVPGRKLVFTWRWEHHPEEKQSLVTVEFRDAGPSRCALKLTHANLTDENMRNEHAKGWTIGLDGLEKMLA